MKSKPVSRYLTNLDPLSFPLICPKFELDFGPFKNTTIVLGDFISVAQLYGASHLSAVTLHMPPNPIMPP